MKPVNRITHHQRQGSALVLSLIFIAMFSALAAAMAGMSGANIQIAENHRKVNNARACAESGLEVIRFWMDKVEISGTTAPDQLFAKLTADLQSKLTNAGITNLVPTSTTIAISNVSVNSGLGQSFSALLTKLDNKNIRVDVTGHYGSFNRTIRSAYTFDDRANNVFDFGVASKGPISLSGNVEIEGVNLQVESNAYIESLNNLLSLSIIGNSHIAGSVKIVNPLAMVHLQGGKAGIGGETGAAAMNHVQIGVEPCEFPEMDPTPFIPYATRVLRASDSTSANATYENLKIPAGMNPSFSGNVVLKGVVFIESPNVVTFSGGVNVTGIIVTNGDPTDNSATNKLKFTGNVTGNPITQLPQQTQFEGLHDKTGTFIMAPGFQVGFGGSFSTLSGAIAANGIELWGKAGGTINGSIVNYSDAPMTLQGNTDLYFNRSGLTEVPAGFVPQLVMFYNPASYEEVP
ncbi:MAG TPA: PilX N-terminal domain-containing pilus assembly protein [Sedimentisphaerales bacterium]|nr:PilX N-terminal domain-containing pilus assembly protein [Sedimentisphaerales bacterium]